MAPDSDADAAALRDRVDSLEQTVADQQATIEALQQPTASRRGVLAALTGVAGAGALGAYSQRASAQAAGQVGTQSEPVDVFANAIDANTVETDEALIGSNYGRAGIGSDFSIQNQSTFTQVPIDSADEDLAGGWDLANDEFVAPADGRFVFMFKPRLSPSTSVSGRLILDVQGANRLDKRNVSISDQEDYQFVTAVNLSEGDSQAFQIFQTLEDGLTLKSTTGVFEYWRLG